jgi:hypothetical protein
MNIDGASWGKERRTLGTFSEGSNRRFNRILLTSDFRPLRTFA